MASLDSHDIWGSSPPPQIRSPLPEFRDQDVELESLDSHDIWGSSPPPQIRSPLGEFRDDRETDYGSDLYEPSVPTPRSSMFDSDEERGSDVNVSLLRSSPEHRTGGNPEETASSPVTLGDRTDDRQPVTESTPSMPNAQPSGHEFSSCLDDVPLQFQFVRKCTPTAQPRGRRFSESLDDVPLQLQLHNLKHQLKDDLEQLHLFGPDCSYWWARS